MWWLWLFFPAFLLLAAFIYHLAFQYWYISKTRGDRYFSLPLKKRLDFQNTLARQAPLLLPLLRFMAKGAKEPRIPAFDFHGVKGPAATASVESFTRAMNYPASEQDIFIVTFMKSGTTWMQNIVFEMLHHGEGDLGDTGYRHMYALSPWLECSPNASVAIENAPCISRYQKRLIKTHLPAHLCPFNHKARYIYVLRHPVKVFTSSENFLQMLMGPFFPGQKALLNLFCSKDMLWGSWPDHLHGWRTMAGRHDNILFIRYEDLLHNNQQTLQCIADFLGIVLSAQDMAKIVAKTSFSYMKAHEFCFEMAPPTLFSVTADTHFLHRGSTPESNINNGADTEKIIGYCSSELARYGINLDEFYPNNQ